MRVAIIPARGGSKRIPGKNIKSFGGRPLIAWSLQAAQESACFDRVIVSTDDDQIAEVALSCGAEVPFLRPAELSDDHCGTIPVISHAIRWLTGEGYVPELACCVYATAPFLRSADIARGLDVLLSSNASYAFSVTSYAYPIQRAIRVNPQQRVEMYDEQYYETRSQDLEEAWHDAGQFYWGRSEAWLNATPILAAQSAAVILPRYRVQDIDTLEDWRRAELMYQAMYVGYTPADP